VVALFLIATVREGDDGRGVQLPTYGRSGRHGGPAPTYGAQARMNRRRNPCAGNARGQAPV
jgi:hypothetical protein